MKRCLTMAADNGMESIAFPSLGRDDLHYPADRVVWCIMTSIIEYFRDTSECSVKKVTVCCDGRDEDLKKVSLGQNIQKIGVELNFKNCVFLLFYARCFLFHSVC